MYSRHAIRLAACAAALGSFALPGRAHAQGAPFTIRRPPDGATVREQVRIEIPRASIGENSFVVFYIDGKFDVAIDPQRLPDTGSSETKSIASRDSKFFTYTWDTKSGSVSDGPHSIRAVLYDPVGNGSSISATQKATSEVKLTVANKIHDGPSSLRLRYKYPEGYNLNYARTSSSIRVGGGVQTGTNADQQLAAINSKLLLGVLSNDRSLALVRNKLTSLAVLSGGQEVTYPENQLSTSMYQELDPEGHVHYETGSATGLLEFTAQGLPVDNTLELPILPAAPVSVGQTWTSPAQRIDIPGLPPALQPSIKLQSTLVDLEWEGNYRTAKIHQHGEGLPLPKDIEFASIPLLSSTASFDRDVYIAYTSGTLVKMTRTLTINGRTSAQLDSQSSSFGGSGGSFGGGMGRPGMMGGPGMPGSGGGMSRPGMMGAPGMPGSGGMMGGPPPGVPGFVGKGGRGIPGSGGMMGGPPGGFPGSGGGMSRPGMMGGPGMPGSGGNRFLGGGGSGFGGGSGGSFQQPADYPVTLKAITDTHLLRITES